MLTKLYMLIRSRGRVNLFGRSDHTGSTEVLLFYQSCKSDRNIPTSSPLYIIDVLVNDYFSVPINNNKI